LRSSRLATRFFFGATLLGLLQPSDEHFLLRDVLPVHAYARFDFFRAAAVRHFFLNFYADALATSNTQGAGGFATM
jgi:hypothetical protein